MTIDLIDACCFFAVEVEGLHTTCALEVSLACCDGAGCLVEANLVLNLCKHVHGAVGFGFCIGALQVVGNVDGRHVISELVVVCTLQDNRCLSRNILNLGEAEPLAIGCSHVSFHVAVQHVTGCVVVHRGIACIANIADSLLGQRRWKIIDVEELAPT